MLRVIQWFPLTPFSPNQVAQSQLLSAPNPRAHTPETLTEHFPSVRSLKESKIYKAWPLLSETFFSSRKGTKWNYCKSCQWSRHGKRRARNCALALACCFRHRTVRVPSKPFMGAGEERQFQFLFLFWAVIKRYKKKEISKNYLEKECLGPLSKEFLLTLACIFFLNF